MTKIAPIVIKFFIASYIYNSKYILTQELDPKTFSWFFHPYPTPRRSGEFAAAGMFSRGGRGVSGGVDADMGGAEGVADIARSVLFF